MPSEIFPKSFHNLYFCFIQLLEEKKGNKLGQLFLFFQKSYFLVFLFIKKKLPSTNSILCVSLEFGTPFFNSLVNTESWN